MSVRVAGERVLEEATRKMRVEGGWVYFGPLGRIRVSELRRIGIPIGVRPGWRRFTESRLLSMRVAALTVWRKAIEMERLLRERRSEIPDDVYRELMLIAAKVGFEARLLLKDIDERLFNVQYALYDVL